MSACHDARNATICQQYRTGLSYEDIAVLHGMTRSRIWQIVREAGDVIPRVHLSRDAYLGVSLTTDMKEALKAEADRQEISMSALTARWIEEQTMTRKPQPAWRVEQERVKLFAALRAMIEAHYSDDDNFSRAALEATEAAEELDRLEALI